MLRQCASKLVNLLHRSTLWHLDHIQIGEHTHHERGPIERRWDARDLVAIEELGQLVPVLTLTPQIVAALVPIQLRL
jgi:hypothetical protein